jgi:hypothetical protein
MMGRKRDNFHLMVIIAFVPIIAIAYFLTQDYAIIDLGFDTQIASDLMSIVPGIFLFIMGVAIVSTIDAGHPVIVGGFTFLGIGIAFLFQELYTIGIITDAMLNPATILQVEELVIITSAMLGGVAWASRR